MLGVEGDLVEIVDADLSTVVALQRSPQDRVRTRKQPSPPSITELFGALGRVHDVREKDGDEKALPFRSPPTHIR